MKRFCDYCNKEYEFDTKMQWMSHRGNCRFGPNFHKKCEKISKRFADKRKQYEFTCKCGQKYNLELTEHYYNIGKYKKHCSRKCANKRIITDSVKLKISNSLKSRNSVNNRIKTGITTYEKICMNCLIEFSTVKYYQNFCGKSCSTSYRNKNRKLSDETKLKLSESLKQQYKNGRPNYAGKTKWYELNTSNGKIKVQGTYEVKAVEILEKYKLESKIKEWEYTKDRIEYVGEDKMKHTYLLDFKVFENADTSYYIETKGYKTKKDELKWKSAKEKGIDLKIWYKNDLFCDR